MRILDSLILGILQGLTEFIPVSSSGHLVVVQGLLPGFKEMPVLFDAMLHLGTLVAVVIYYKRELGLILTSLFPQGYNRGPKETREGRRLLVLLILASIPTGLMGFLFKRQVEELFEKPQYVGYFLLVTGGVLILTDLVRSRGKGMMEMQWWKALLIGVCQGLAIVPGISRSGMTIASGIFTGVRRDFATEFAFLLSVPAVAGAVLLETASHMSTFVRDVDFVAYLFGMFIAGIVGFLSIGWLLKIVQMKRLAYFGIYCWVVGIGSIIVFH